MEDSIIIMRQVNMRHYVSVMDSNRQMQMDMDLRFLSSFESQSS
jgi:hypothetical protein